MNMKLLIPAVLLLAVSCAKEGPELFEGSWSFKTGGTLTYVVPESGDISADDGTDAPQQYDTLKVTLATESGQMHIVGTSGNAMVVTMNAIGGGVAAFEASADGDRMMLEPLSRLLPVGSGSLLSSYAEVQVAGTGERFGDILILHLDYAGNILTAGRRYEIIESSVECVATLNE